MFGLTVAEITTTFWYKDLERIFIWKYLGLLAGIFLCTLQKSERNKQMNKYQLGKVKGQMSETLNSHGLALS